MIHGIPKPFLIWLKKDLKRHTRSGYRVFYEGVRVYQNDEKRAKYSEKELEVSKCKKFFESIKEEAIKSMNLTAQFSCDEEDTDGIEYPDNAINIDISYVECIRMLTKLLAENNIDCKGIVSVVEGIPHEKMISGIAETTENLLSGKVTLKELNIKATTLDFFRISDLVEMEYRNEVAARKIENISKRRKIDRIYVHYGQFHIEGIVDILANKYGWKIVKTIEINSQNPALRQKRL